ncbi:MAG: HAD hydrolase family protein [Phycisphaerales bacterium]
MTAMRDPIRLLAIDLDGTLLQPDGRVAARDAAAVRMARDAGIDVVIATGRAIIESQSALDAIGREGAFIGAGGAILNDAISDATLDRATMPAEVVTSLVDCLISHGHAAHLLKDADRCGYDYAIIGQGALNPATEWWFRTFPVRVRHFARLEDDEHPHETVRCGTVAHETSLSAVVQQIRDDIGDGILLQHWEAVTESAALGVRTHLLEAFSPGVDKWWMLERYAQQRGIGPAAIAAIGDGLNDVSMVREAGLGIAMANASPAVMHVADQVTVSNSEAGVAAAISTILANV